MFRLHPTFRSSLQSRTHAGCLLAAAFAASASAAARPAPAAPGSPILFSPVVIEATGYGAAPFDLPYSTSVYTSERLGQRLPRTLPAALEELPGLMIQKTGTAQGSPYLRGFTGFRTLLLVDGIRVNNSAFREGPNQYWGTVDPLALSRLEVVMGPSSVLFGSDAIGGTVNALTLSPTRAAAGSGPTANGRLLYRHATADESHIGRFDVSAHAGSELSARLGASYKDYSDLRAGSGTGRQSHTGYTEKGGDGSLVRHLDEHTQLSLLWQHFAQDDAWRTHSTVFGSTWLGVRPGNDRQRSLDQRRNLFAVQFRTAQLAGAVDSLHASVSRQSQREDQFRLRNDGRREDTGFGLETLGTFIQAQSRTPAGRWTYGGELYRDRVDSYSVRYRADGGLSSVDIQGPIADDATYDLAGGYLENRLSRLGPVDLVVGGRYNYAAARARRVRDPLTGTAIAVAEHWHSFVGSLRGVVPLDRDQRHRIFAGISQAFRAPNLSDLTRFDIAEGGQIETPAPGLEPEKFLTGELGWRAQHGRWSASAAWFYTDIRNQIIRTPTGARVEGLVEVTKRNSGSGYVHGLECSGSLRLPADLVLIGNLTWMRGDLDYYPTADASRLERAPLSRVMPLTGHLALRWAPPAARWWGELAASAAARQDRLAPSDQVDTERIPARGTPGYGVVHLRGGWRPTADFTLTAGIENLGDKDYRIHGSGVNEPGRNFIVSAEYRF